MLMFEFDLFADYFQFYVQDEKAHRIDGDSWDADAVERMLAVAEGAIGDTGVRRSPLRRRK
jgi:hypothetical protein